MEINIHKAKYITSSFGNVGSTNWLSIENNDLEITWFAEPGHAARFRAYAEAIEAVNKAFDEKQAEPAAA